MERHLRISAAPTSEKLGDNQPFELLVLFRSPLDLPSLFLYIPSFLKFKPNYSTISMAEQVHAILGGMVAPIRIRVDAPPG
jgi:hypothetical protein